MFKSKLPNTQVSIFSIMSNLANDYGAINLSQGFPDFEIDSKLPDLVYEYMRMGKNQYAPMLGVTELREQIAIKINTTYNRSTQIDRNIVVTAGATQALYTAITALVQKNDEVIVITPAYDSYIPAIELCGAKVIEVPFDLEQNKMPWEQIRASISANTTMIITNNPFNPVGYVFDASDINQLKEIIDKNPQITLLSDEVYEHIVFDQQKHISALTDELLFNHTIATFSFGKTFHTTGWKMGYAVGPEHLMNEFKKVHQYNVFSVNTPAQYAIAHYMNEYADYDEISQLYEQKRNLFLKNINTDVFSFVPSQGTYFQLINYKNFSKENDIDLAKRLTSEAGVASIPLSPFYHKIIPEHYFLRFCFAKQNSTLSKAAELLNTYSEKLSV